MGVIAAVISTAMYFDACGSFCLVCCVWAVLFGVTMPWMEESGIDCWVPEWVSSQLLFRLRHTLMRVGRSVRFVACGPFCLGRQCLGWERVVLIARFRWGSDGGVSAAIGEAGLLCGCGWGAPLQRMV